MWYLDTILLYFREYGPYNNLLEAAGATRLRISLIIYRGSEDIATITATFHRKRNEVTNSKSRKNNHQRAINVIHMHIYQNTPEERRC